MKEFIHNHVIVAITLVLIVVAIGLGSWTAERSKLNVIRALDVQIAGIQDHLATVSQTTDRNGALREVENIIADCARRNEYEDLLNKLGTLQKRDLVTVQTLNESCGPFYAERKALMVVELRNTVEQLEDLIELKKVLIEGRENEYRLTDWQQLSTLEETRSSMLTEQQQLQSKIISALVSGVSAQSPEVQNYLRTANEIAELLTITDTQIDALRTTLVPSA